MKLKFLKFPETSEVSKVTRVSCCSESCDVTEVSSIFETFRKFPDSENLLPIRQRIVISKEQGTEHFPPGTGETN